MLIAADRSNAFPQVPEKSPLDGPYWSGIAKAPGTCGELVQGQSTDGRDFLVTFPINLWAEVHVELSTTSPDIQGIPVGKEKTQQAIRRTLDYLGYPLYGAIFKVSSEIPEGKGMASSTADIVAACYAIADALGQSLSPEEISNIAIQIEPSDGIMYPDVVAYDHRRGNLIDTLGKLPPTKILALDFGGHVDTLEFNQKDKSYSEKELAEIKEAYELVKTGVQEQLLKKIGQAATMSAKVNQRLLPKPYLDTLIEIAEEYEAHGVCIAHSGTIAALLFDRDAEQAFDKARAAILKEVDPKIEIYSLQSI